MLLTMIRQECNTHEPAVLDCDAGNFPEAGTASTKTVYYTELCPMREIYVSFSTAVYWKNQAELRKLEYDF